jgi:uncharacterized protein (TIGR00299 family) protein
MRHVHLDPLGGVAGDMFAAALLDAMPDQAAAVAAAVRRVVSVTVGPVPHRDHVLTGKRFVVGQADPPPDHRHDHDHDHDHEHVQHHEHHTHTHAHTHWSAIRRRIEQAGLAPDVTRHALSIFGELAEAEALVHGIAVDDVAFHEVGAVDSIADIVAAATLIAACGPATWSVGALPVGGGRVATAHGPMPVPAPATALLMRGFAFVDDGVAGERVTPTGAAILRHLRADSGAVPGGVRLALSGTGFGTRALPGLSNCLRVLVFEAAEQHTAPAAHRTLAVLQFEVDDQTPEELAAGLDAIRAVEGIHDVLQMPVYGKKGRIASHVQVLARPDAAEAAAAACFRETTTIGLRLHHVEGRALPRAFSTVDVAGTPVGVKLVERPDGSRTAKAESDHARALPGHAARATLRREAERRALEDAAS